MRRMLAASAISIALLFTASCKEGWNDENRTSYLEACRTSGNGVMLDSAQRETYCQCSLEKVMKHYDDVESVIINKDSTQMNAGLADCMQRARK